MPASMGIGGTQRLPDFFIVGAGKSGTTSLSTYLSRHPEIFMSPVKEPHYYSTMVPPGPKPFPRIADRSAYVALFADARSNQCIGEASTTYLPEPSAAARIHADAPHAKIIIILRDPIERAYSHFRMSRRMGWEKSTFLEAVQGAHGDLGNGWGYVAQGLYAKQVERYLQVFGPNQTLIILYEDLKANAIEVVNRVAMFLELDPRLFPPDTTEGIENPNLEPRSRLAKLFLGSRLKKAFKAILPASSANWLRNHVLWAQRRPDPPDPRAVEWLRTIFAPDVEQLELILGRDLAPLRCSW